MPITVIGVDDTSLAPDEFLHADVQQEILKLCFRIEMEDLPNWLSLVPVPGDLVAAGASLTSVLAYPARVAAGCQGIRIRAYADNHGTAPARFMFRYYFGQGVHASTGELPLLDGDWDVAGWYLYDGVLPLAKMKDGHPTREGEITIHAYCKLGCELVSVALLGEP